jgi:hypothetical protein
MSSSNIDTTNLTYSRSLVLRILRHNLRRNGNVVDIVASYHSNIIKSAVASLATGQSRPSP